MKKCVSDIRLIIGFFLAHLLLFLTYEDKQVFWYIFTASMLFLISYSILVERMEDNASVLTYMIFGILSGMLIYGVFWIGDSLSDYFQLPFSNQITKLYDRYSPTEFWHYILLVLIIVPGEEIFWRGFVQKRILTHTNAIVSIVLSTLLYASVQFYSGQLILVIAALVGGLFWGTLYAWKRSVPLVIISHLTFGLLSFLIFPFR